MSRNALQRRHALNLALCRYRRRSPRRNRDQRVSWTWHVSAYVVAGGLWLYVITGLIEAMRGAP